MDGILRVNGRGHSVGGAGALNLVLGAGGRGRVLSVVGRDGGAGLVGGGGRLVDGSARGLNRVGLVHGGGGLGSLVLGHGDGSADKSNDSEGTHFDCWGWY